MVKVEALGAGWLIDTMIYFGEEKNDNAKMTLSTVRGDYVRYGDDLQTVIDFPGEYDVNGVTVKGWYTNGSMSYLVKTHDICYGLVANAAALDLGSYDEAENIFCLNQNAVDEAEKMELAGDIQLFADAADGKPVAAKVSVEHPEEDSEEE